MVSEQAPFCTALYTSPSRELAWQMPSEGSMMVSASAAHTLTAIMSQLDLGVALGSLSGDTLHYKPPIPPPGTLFL